jgi:hypothetical protein
MKSVRLIILAAACSIAATLALADLPKGYETLAHKSIFSRDRVSWNPTSRRTTSGPALPLVPVVTGIVREDIGGYVGVIETPGSGRPVLVHVGDPLPGNRGVVTEMNLDCFVFVPGPGQAPRKALVGRNLDGAESTLVPATTNPSDAPIEGEDIISRMRRRRQQEGK